MYCRKCGNEVSESDKFCKKCGESIGITKEMMEKYKREINSYLGLGIVAILFCIPFGVTGIIFSTEVEKNIKKGDIEKAKKCSRKAKNFSIIGMAAGIPLTIIYILLVIISEIAKWN